MEKISNFKVDFTRILSDKYRLTKEEINGYWLNKAKEEERDKEIKCLKSIYISIFGVDPKKIINSPLCHNQYKKEEYREIDREYRKLKSKYKRFRK